MKQSANSIEKKFATISEQLEQWNSSRATLKKTPLIAQFHLRKIKANLIYKPRKHENNSEKQLKLMLLTHRFAVQILLPASIVLCESSPFPTIGKHEENSEALLNSEADFSQPEQIFSVFVLKLHVFRVQDVNCNCGLETPERRCRNRSGNCKPRYMTRSWKLGNYDCILYADIRRLNEVRFVIICHPRLPLSLDRSSLLWQS